MRNREKIIVLLGVFTFITSIIIGVARTATVPEKVIPKPDYERLSNLLAAGLLEKADRQTYRILLLIAKNESVPFSASLSLTDVDLSQFPCEELRKIDATWKSYAPQKVSFVQASQILQQNSFKDVIISRMKSCEIPEFLSTH